MYGTKTNWIVAMSRRNCILFLEVNGMTAKWQPRGIILRKEAPLWIRNKGANIANPYNKEGNWLQEKIYEVVVPPIGKIIASTEKEVCPH